jgi:phosphopantetheinyl transferase (holo-ACP synthase)
LLRALVGNDVVDLGEPDAAASARRAGFLERVCSPSEVAAVHAAASPERALWCRFAAKEAAFKVVAKLRPGVVLAHRLFAVAYPLDAVTFEDLRLHLVVEVKEEHVHAIASTVAGPVVVALEARGERDASLAARQLLCERVSQLLGCPASALRVVRDAVPGAWDGFGPPRLELDGAPSGLDVSLSHDGRFVAAAAVRSP